MGLRERIGAEGKVRVLGLIGLGLLAVLPLRGEEEFIRGDVDTGGSVSLDDAFWIIAYLFRGHVESLPCDDAADVDDSGEVELTDAIYLLNYLFRGGPSPAPPYPLCGTDASGDRLHCTVPGDCPEPLEVAGIFLYSNALVFVMDHSGSMEEKCDRVRGEVLRLLDGLPESSRFGTIYYSSGLLRYPERGGAVPATAEHVEAARTFVETTPCRMDDTCPLHALVSALRMLRSLPSGADPRMPLYTRRAIVLFTDGGGNCGAGSETQLWRYNIETFTEVNNGDAILHVVAVGEPSDVRSGFLRELAGRNGGQYAELRPEGAAPDIGRRGAPE